MPALKIYGRRWHMATDMIPLPALSALIIHTLWIIIFGPVVQAYNVFPDRPCVRPGVQYQAVCGGFLAIYGLSWVFELALFIVGCRGMSFGQVTRRENRTKLAASAGRNVHSLMCCYSAGTPLEVQKRKAVVPLLYIMSFLWLAQTVFAGKHSTVMQSCTSCMQRACFKPTLSPIQIMTYMSCTFDSGI